MPGQFVAVPAFHTSYVADLHSGALSRRYGSIWWDDAVMNIINDESIVRLALQPKYLPMLVPARPWTRFNDGGHLVLESLMMRGGYSRLGPSVAQLKDLERMQRDMDKARVCARARRLPEGEGRGASGPPLMRFAAARARAGG